MHVHLLLIHLMSFFFLFLLSIERRFLNISVLCLYSFLKDITLDVIGVPWEDMHAFFVASLHSFRPKVSHFSYNMFTLFWKKTFGLLSCLYQILSLHLSVPCLFASHCQVNIELLTFLPHKENKVNIELQHRFIDAYITSSVCGLICLLM